MVGEETELKKKRFLSLCPKIRFPESFWASGTNICWLVPIFIFAPYLVVVGFYESRYHAYVQMNDLAGHNYAVIFVGDSTLALCRPSDRCRAARGPIRWIL